MDYEERQSCCKLNFLSYLTKLETLVRLELELSAKSVILPNSKFSIFRFLGSIYISNCSARRDESIGARLSSLAQLVTELELGQVWLFSGR